MNIETNRRNFLKSSLALLATTMVTGLETGCSQDQIAGLTQLLGTESANIVNAMGNATMAATITSNTTAAVNAIKNWTKGSPTQEISEALGILMDNLNLIPIASPYISLIDICIATAQALLAMFPAVVQSQLKAVHKSRTVSIGHKAPTTAADFKKLINAEVKAKNYPATLAIK